MTPVSLVILYFQSRTHTFEGPSIGTKLYPHQKKALTFILEREHEIAGPTGRAPSLWQFKEHERVWQHMITLKTSTVEPVEAKGSLLADDVSMRKPCIEPLLTFVEDGSWENDHMCILACVNFEICQRFRLDALTRATQASAQPSKY